MKIQKFQSALVVLFAACVVSPIAATAQQPSPSLGKTNLHAWIDEAPGLPNSLEEAATRKNGQSVYQPFYDKVQAFKKSYKQDMTGRAKPDEAEMRSAAEAQASSNLARLNSNPVIAQMGGIEKLSQMTPAQRAQLAQQMMQGGTKQSFAAPGGRTSTGMQAMMQKVMTDPAYRARYEKMSQQEKEAELRRFMASDGVSAPKTTEQIQDEQSQARPRLQAANEAAATFAIRQDLQEMMQQRNALDTAFSARDTEITTAKGSHREINEDAAGKLAKIPMVNDSIMGRVHDLQLTATLNKDTAAKHRDRAIWELQQRNALVADQRLKLKDLASSYQHWLKTNQDRINGSTAQEDLLRGANTGIEVAQYEVSFIDAAYDLAKYSEAGNKDAANYQELYLQGNGAIRLGR
jgi:hypothetical protein